MLRTVILLFFHRLSWGIAWPLHFKFASYACAFIHFAIMDPSGGFRNLERGVQPLAREALAKIFGLPRPLLFTYYVRNY